MTRLMTAILLALCAWPTQTANAQAPSDSTVTFVHVSAGAFYTCALASDGTAYCWGANLNGQLGEATADTCNENPCGTTPVAVSGGLHFASIAAGQYHNCGLTADGTAYCWGGNIFGGLGRDDSENECVFRDSGQEMPFPCSRAPVPVAGELRFASLSVGGNHSCGLTDEGAVYCWGLNNLNQLGRDSGDEVCKGGPMPEQPCSRHPGPVTGEAAFASVSAGYTHTCALSSDGKPYCWGGMSGTLLGAPDYRNFRYGNAPTEISSDQTFFQLNAGVDETCGLVDDGTPYCWGAFVIRGGGRRMGQVRRAPTLVGTPPPWLKMTGEAEEPTEAELDSWKSASVTVGALHACGLTRDGSLYCWGDDDSGQLGVGGGDAQIKPVRVAEELTFAVVSAGSLHTCGVTSDGRVLCWGDNSGGQLGIGSTKGKDEPTPVNWEP